jgi:hypothetical protein
VTPVKSSNIKAVHYEPATGKLKVAFHSGSTWEYDGVPGYHHQGLMAADSAGSYFHQNIKGRHKGRLVE